MPRFSNRIRHWFLLTPREYRVVLGVSVLFLLSALAYVWPNVRMVLLAYDFQKQERVHQALLRENSLLRLERDSLTHLDRIGTLAEKDLGMRSPESGQVVTVFLK